MENPTMAQRLWSALKSPSFILSICFAACLSYSIYLHSIKNKHHDLWQAKYKGVCAIE